MNIENLNQLVDWIETKVGLKSTPTHLLILKEVLVERMTLCKRLTYEEYGQYLQTHVEELQEIIERMVVLETWFFRETRLFDALSLWLQQNKNQNAFFKVLSLACSTGEEPYSIAMTFFNAGLSKNTFKIEAWDISQQALIKAQKGIYRVPSFRGQNRNYLQRYFHKTLAGYAIQEAVKAQVHFHQGNVLEIEKQVQSPPYQLIFCRHFLMYLTPQAQTQVLSQIKRLLAPTGILIVGSAETQIARRAGFIFASFPLTHALMLNPESTTSVMTPTQKSFSSLHAKSEKPALQGALPASAHLEEKNKESLLQEATQLANAGSFEKAMHVCLNFVNQYGSHPDIYYLMGLLNQVNGQEEKAEDFFQKTIYLKPSHYEALVCLTLLYEKKGEWNKANLFRRRAQKNL